MFWPRPSVLIRSMQQHRFEHQARYSITTGGANSFRFSVENDQKGFTAVHQALQRRALDKTGEVRQDAVGIDPEESGVVQAGSSREALLKTRRADQRGTGFPKRDRARRQAAVHRGYQISAV